MWRPVSGLRAFQHIVQSHLVSVSDTLGDSESTESAFTVKSRGSLPLLPIGDAGGCCCTLSDAWWPDAAVLVDVYLLLSFR
jgi:hypothetical protein